jgi:hypothetical protein
MATANGPVPGTVRALTSATIVQMTQLILPAYYRITNLEPLGGNFVTVGVWDHDQSRFIPFGEVLPGESYVGRFSRYLQSELGTGSGTDHSAGNRLCVKADTAPLNVLIETFDN